MFMGVNTLEPLIANSNDVPPELRETVETKLAGCATKQIRFPITNAHWDARQAYQGPNGPE